MTGMACIWSGVSSRVGGWDTVTRWKRENEGLVCWKPEGGKIHNDVAYLVFCKALSVIDQGFCA